VTRVFMLGLWLLTAVLSTAGKAGPDDFHRELAAHWSPCYWQDTGRLPEADYITAFDADGDWIGANNLESLKGGRFEPYPAEVYFVVLETRTHWLIIYEVFHAFDYDRVWMKPVKGAFHENDTEGVMLVVEKSAGREFGEFRLMETRPHGYVRHYALDARIRLRGPGRIEKASFRGSHPEVYIQRGGHGPYGLHARGGAVRIIDGFHRDRGVVYNYRGRAETPKGPDDRDVGYALIEVTDSRGLWARRCNKEAFDGYRGYEAPPGRPGVPQELLCQGGGIPFSLDGDTEGESSRPDAAGVPWGHFSPDPARVVANKWRLPEEFSVDYVYNPFLGIDLPSGESAGKGREDDLKGGAR